MLSRQRATRAPFKNSCEDQRRQPLNPCRIIKSNDGAVHAAEFESKNGLKSNGIDTAVFPTWRRARGQHPKQHQNLAWWRCRDSTVTVSLWRLASAWRCGLAAGHSFAAS